MTRPMYSAEKYAYVLGAPYDEIHAERLRAHAKHAETSMESQPVHDPDGTRRDILVEEIGEVSREFNEARHDRRPVDLAHLRVELIQVAAMASAWVAAIDGNSLAALASPGDHFLVWHEERPELCQHYEPHTHRPGFVEFGATSPAGEES